MKINKFVVKLTFIIGFLTLYSAFPKNSMAQECEYSWPTISIEWGIGPDNYYANGTGEGSTLFGHIVSTCTACACEDVSVSGDVYIDSQVVSGCGGSIPFDFYRPAAMAEGSHNAEVKFTAVGSVTGSTRSYSFSKDFYIDNSQPTRHIQVASATNPLNTSAGV